MEFVQKFTLPDFQAKNFTPSISPHFNSFSGKKHKKLVKMEKFTLLAKIFTLPPALTAWTNSTSGYAPSHLFTQFFYYWALASVIEQEFCMMSLSCNKLKNEGPV